MRNVIIIIIMETKRIEALADGIFAIAMTLLILEIHIPEIHNASTSELFQELSRMIPQFASFFISFLILGISWIGHHNQFKFIKKSDRVFLWLNILYFMFISVIPFSAGFLGHYTTNEASIIVYSLNLTLVGIVLFLHWNYAVSHKLTEGEISAKFMTHVNIRILIGPVVYLLAIGVSFVNVYVSLFIFLIPALFQIFPGAVDEFLK